MSLSTRKLISDKLRSIRAYLDYSIEYVATKAKLGKDTIYRYENNSVSMQVDVLERILNVYGYDFYIFFQEIYAKKQNEKEE